MAEHQTAEQTLHEFENLLVLLESLALLDQIDLVLQDDYMLELHDLNGGEMLRGLWLRTRLIAGYEISDMGSTQRCERKTRAGQTDEQQGGVHHCGTVEHGRHENVVAGAVHK